MDKICPYASFCHECHVNTNDYPACARYKAAGIKGIEMVPADMGAIDYHKLPALCLQ